MCSCFQFAVCSREKSNERVLIMFTVHCSVWSILLCSYFVSFICLSVMFSVYLMFSFILLVAFPLYVLAVLSCWIDDIVKYDKRQIVYTTVSKVKIFKKLASPHRDVKMWQWNRLWTYSVRKYHKLSIIVYWIVYRMSSFGVNEKIKVFKHSFSSSSSVHHSICWNEIYQLILFCFVHSRLCGHLNALIHKS